MQTRREAIATIEETATPVASPELVELIDRALKTKAKAEPFWDAFTAADRRYDEALKQTPRRVVALDNDQFIEILPSVDREVSLDRLRSQYDSAFKVINEYLPGAVRDGARVMLDSAYDAAVLRIRNAHDRLEMIRAECNTDAAEEAWLSALRTADAALIALLSFPAETAADLATKRDGMRKVIGRMSFDELPDAAGDALLSSFLGESYGATAAMIG